MSQDEKTLADVLRDLWSAKVYLFFSAIIGFVFAVLFLAVSTPHYKAEMIIAPAHSFGHSLNSAPEGTIHAQTEQLSNDEAFERFSHIFSLPSMSQKLLEKDTVRLGLKEVGEDAKRKDYFKRKIHIEPVSGTSFRRLFYYHPDPKFAIELLTLVHGMTDEHIRRAVLNDTNERITYLNDAMSRSVNPEHRRTLAALMMEQERIRMMVSLDQPFSASVVEPAFASARPRWPDSYVIYPVFIFVGLLLGFVVYGLRHNV